MSKDLGAQLYWWRAGTLLMLGMLLAMPSKSLPTWFASIMALAGFWAFGRAPRKQFLDPLIRLAIGLFLCLWIPMLLALPDALNLERALQTTGPYLRFLGMALFVIDQARQAPMAPALLLGILCIVSFWCLDALLQYFTGVDLFGLPGAPGSVYGVFYPEITLGHVAAALSPWYFHALYQWRHRAPWLAILLIPFVLTVLLSQRRAAWIMLALSTVIYLWFTRHTLFERAAQRWRAVAGALVLAIALAGAVLNDSGLQQRMHHTFGLFSGDYQTVNLATASRLNLWEAAWRMFTAHWLNGLGPRGYRFAYTEYSPPDDIFHAEGQTHPHQLVLEVMVETGVIGLAGLVLFCVIAHRHLRRDPNLSMAWPGVLAVIVAAFPLNTHMAFYGSYWAGMFWWLVASALAHLASERTIA